MAQEIEYRMTHSVTGFEITPMEEAPRYPYSGPIVVVSASEAEAELSVWGLTYPNWRTNPSMPPL
jgi:hypothetical protein